MKSTLQRKLNALIFPALAAFALLGTLGSVEATGYLKIGDIKGEATDDGHKEWINLLSVSQTMSRPLEVDGAVGTRTRGPLVLGDIVVVKELDKSSPKLAEAVCLGTVFPELEVHLCTPVDNTNGTLGTRQEPYLKYKLKDVYVTSYSFHGSAGGDTYPSEEVSFGYTEVEWTFISLDPKAGAAKEIVTTSSSGAATK